MAHLSESVSLWTPTGLGSTGMLKEHRRHTINLRKTGSVNLCKLVIADTVCSLNIVFF